MVNDGRSLPQSKFTPPAGMEYVMSQMPPDIAALKFGVDIPSPVPVDQVLKYILYCPKSHIN